MSISPKTSCSLWRKRFPSLIISPFSTMKAFPERTRSCVLSPYPADAQMIALMSFLLWLSNEERSVVWCPALSGKAESEKMTSAPFSERVVAVESGDKASLPKAMPKVKSGVVNIWLGEKGTCTSPIWICASGANVAPEVNHRVSDASEWLARYVLGTTPHTFPFPTTMAQLYNCWLYSKGAPTIAKVVSVEVASTMLCNSLFTASIRGR